MVILCMQNDGVKEQARLCRPVPVDKAVWVAGP